MTSRRTHIIRLAFIFLALIIAFLWWATQPDVARQPIGELYDRRPNIQPMREQKFPTISMPKIVGWQGDAKPVAAPGLQVQLYADKLDHPRWMTLLPNGDVLVAESTQPDRDLNGLMDRITMWMMKRGNGSNKSANRITLLRDADKDGRVEYRSQFLTEANGLNSPFGMALMGDTLYVGNTNALIAFPYKTGDTTIAVQGQKIIDLPANAPNNHWTRNVIATQDGTRLYVTVGSNSNIAENGMDKEKLRANILEVEPKQKAGRVFAYGLRNPTGLAIDPWAKRLWTTVNERDMLGSDGPPDYMAAVIEGKFYGWPYYYWGGNPDERVQDFDWSLQQYAARGDYALGPHTASLGLAFTDAIRLGAPFEKGAFVGQHGSWNRSPVSGFKVIYVPFNENAFAEGAPKDVLAGFLNADGEAQGRPVGVIGDANGAMLVADDAGNRIWRVTPITK